MNPKREKELSKEKTKSVFKNTTTDEQLPKDFSSFQQLKGKLNWPVNDGRIIKKFGER